MTKVVLMERRYDLERGPVGSLTAEEAEELFSKVDNSGHANAERAEKELLACYTFGDEAPSLPPFIRGIIC
jgi:hypothetical protein